MTANRRQGALRPKVWRFALGLAAVVGLALSILAVPPSASATIGIGGGTDFLTGAVFPFVSGESAQVETGMYVQNIGDEVAEVEMKAELPVGVVLEPLVEVPLVLEPGQMRDYDFAIQVSEALAPGRYEIITTVGQVNLEREEGETGSLYVPAIAGRFFLDVVGESGSVIIEPVSDATGLPANGTISLYFLDGVTGEVLLDSVQGTALERDVVPGNYRATFDVEGLQRQSLDFEVGPGEAKRLEMEIPTISFEMVDAQPTLDADGGIVTAELIVAVNNSLRRIDGPVEFQANAVRAGQLQEAVVIATVAELAPGITQHRVSYRPSGGFQGGVWEFEFSVTSPDFTITAVERPGFTAPGFVESNWEYIALGVLSFLLLLAVVPRGWWVIALRRRKKDDEEADALEVTRAS